jgi:hypothetical protein
MLDISKNGHWNWCRFLILALKLRLYLKIYNGTLIYTVFLRTDTNWCRIFIDLQLYLALFLFKWHWNWDCIWEFTTVPYLGLHNAQDFAWILWFVGEVHIINRNNVFHSFPNREITCPPIKPNTFNILQLYWRWKEINDS